jgi:hypothetical protein
MHEFVENTFVRLIFLRANTASALKSCPGPSSSEKTMLVWRSYDGRTKFYLTVTGKESRQIAGRFLYLIP